MSSARVMENAIPSLSVTATAGREAVAETAGTDSGGAGAAAGPGEDEDAETGAGGATGAGASEAGGGAALTGTALGSRMASMMFSGTRAFDRRITSWADRLKAVFELRIWLRMMACETFASIICMMLSLVSA